MSLKGLLANIMYKDKATVYRVQTERSSTGFDDDVSAEVPVYQDIPCKLSQYGKDLMALPTSTAMEVSIELRLCCAPDILIQENDRLVITTRQGQTFELYAGVRFAYPTHQEISVRRQREVAQNGNAV